MCIVERLQVASETLKKHTERFTFALRSIKARDIGAKQVWESNVGRIEAISLEHVQAEVRFTVYNLIALWLKPLNVTLKVPLRKSSLTITPLHSRMQSINWTSNTAGREHTKRLIGRHCLNAVATATVKMSTAIKCNKLSATFRAYLSGLWLISKSKFSGNILSDWRQNLFSPHELILPWIWGKNRRLFKLADQNIHGKDFEEQPYQRWNSPWSVGSVRDQSVTKVTGLESRQKLPRFGFSKRRKIILEFAKQRLMWTHGYVMKSRTSCNKISFATNFTAANATAKRTTCRKQERGHLRQTDFSLCKRNIFALLKNSKKHSDKSNKRFGQVRRSSRDASNSITWKTYGQKNEAKKHSSQPLPPGAVWQSTLLPAGDTYWSCSTPSNRSRSNSSVRKSSESVFGKPRDRNSSSTRRHRAMLKRTRSWTSS